MTVKFSWRQDGDFFIGHLKDYPDYETQGTTFEELKENLLDLYADLSGGEVPFALHEAELVLA